MTDENNRLPAEFSRSSEVGLTDATYSGAQSAEVDASSASSPVALAAEVSEQEVT